MEEKKSFMKLVAAAVAVFTCIGFTGCIDDARSVKEEGGSTTEANTFDFSTKKNVSINLQYPVSRGYRVQFEMYTISPLTLDDNKSYVKDSTLVPFLSGMTDENGKVAFTGELSSSVKEIYAYSTGIGVPVLMKASVNADGVVSEFQKAAIPTAKSTRAASNPSGTTSWKTYSSTLHKPTLPTTKMTILESDKMLIDKSFPINQEYISGNTYYQPCIRLNEKATVKIYSVSNGFSSDRTNALAYFVYSKDRIEPADINSNLQLAFPELNKTTPAEGDGYQLLNNGGTEFEAGSRIGFALFPDITPGNINTQNAHVLYSYFNGDSWNSYVYPGLFRANVPHMVLSVLRKDANGHAIIAIAFEDQPFAIGYGTNRGDFRDNIFILEIDPATALPDDLPKPPTDEPSYDIEFKTTGILCFEDCWPAKGDYDINDVVVSYERALCMKNGGVAALKDKYTFMHNGAQYVNGFGFQVLGATRSSIKECKVKSDYTCPNQGLDATSDQAVVKLFENGKNVKTGTTFDVFVSFEDKAWIAGINPFIVTAGSFSVPSDLFADGRIEVHLPTTKTSSGKYYPTSKANTTYWGTQDDKSDPSNKIYYVREGNYPFALEIQLQDNAFDVADFFVPTENKKIDETYPEFVKWVESNGKENTDWYLHPNK